MIKFLSKKHLEEQFKKENPSDFRTHAHYVRFFSELSENVRLEYKRGVKERIKKSNLLSKKTKLVSFTMKSIEEEMRIISDEESFATACCSWIPVKSYYVIFNLLLILKYLLTCQEKSFFCGHKAALNYFKGLIDNKEMVFSEEKLNKVYKGKNVKKILEWTATPGENITTHGFDEEVRFKHIIKKIAKHEREKFKKKESISRLTEKRENKFWDGRSINLCDFFYCYRIEANYGGLDFLDKNISNCKFKDFYTYYYKLTNNYYGILKKTINEISLRRIGEEAIK